MVKHITIGELSRQAGVSRSTLLYYERVGLLKPASRSMGNYRLYSQNDVEKLRQVKLYREMALPIKKIIDMLGSPRGKKTNESIAILKKHLDNIGLQISKLHEQQAGIVKLIEQLKEKKNRKSSPTTRARSKGCVNVSLLNKENDMVSKERWVEIMQAAGFSEADMMNWHKQFESMEPDAHQEFLESLDIDADEIASIREWSRK